MITLKVPLENAEKIRKELIQENNLDTDYALLKDDAFLYIPVKKKFKSKYEFVNKSLEKTEKKESFKDILNEKLTKKEIESLKTAYDHVGDIAIIEIDDALLKKEKIIAEALLKTNKTIKTVLKKGGIHEGEFRTQKMEYLAGINQKETIHKENNVNLKVNVEKVYFSPRLSTERKRISELVKKDEEILVMFSGAAPYPCVLSKNTDAKSIIGIEMNPEGHKYGLENIKLNKLKNVRLICGDVNKVIPDLNKQFIGLKTNTDINNIKKRLKECPGIVELYLKPDELDIEDSTVQKAIDFLKKANVSVMIHSPHSYKGKDIDLSSKDIKITMHAKELFEKLHKLSAKNSNVLGFVFHPLTSKGNFISNDEEQLLFNLNLLLKCLEYGYMENILHDNVFSKYDSLLKISKKIQIRGICFDFAHYIKQNSWDEKKFINLINEIKKYKQVYFHILDADISKKRYEARLKNGAINFENIQSHIDFGIIEVFNNDESNPIESIEDYNYFLSLKNQMKFDRILMPLPKSAEDFLDAALLASKKGTIIHFYDFLNENDFELAYNKIDKACKRNKLNYKVLKLIKCGQHAPKVYRICVDFQII